MNFKKYLTVEERADMWNVGFIRKLASVGKKPSDLGLTKDAQLQWVGNAIKGTAQGIKDLGRSGFGLALLAGLPTGIALHFIDRDLKNDSVEVQKLKRKKDLYNAAVIEAVKALERKERD